MTDRIPLILWTGGADSTLLLFDKLKNGPVDTLYLNSAQGESKSFKELNAIEKIIDSEEYQKLPFKIRDRKVVEMQKGGLPFGVSQDLALTQPLLWITGALLVCNRQRHSEVMMGYVMGDDVCGALSNMMNAWDQLEYVTKAGVSGESVRLVFPLQWTSKETIYKELRRLNIEKLVWSCELPAGDGTQCGECIPCKKASLYKEPSLEHTGEISKGLS